MSYPPDILNPESLADVLKQSCATTVVDDPQGAGSIERLGALVELLVMYVPLDNYEAVLNEFAAQPEGKELPAAVKAVADAVPPKCSTYRQGFAAGIKKAARCAVCDKPIGPAVWCSIACMEKHIGPIVCEPKT